MVLYYVTFPTIKKKKNIKKDVAMLALAAHILKLE